MTIQYGLFLTDLRVQNFLIKMRVAVLVLFASLLGSATACAIAVGIASVPRPGSFAVVIASVDHMFPVLAFPTRIVPLANAVAMKHVQIACL